MSSNKRIYSSIIFMLLLFAFGCGESVKESASYATYNPSQTNIMQLSFIGMIDEAPVYFPDVWNRNVLSELGINAVTIFTKGGKNPEDTLEKIEFKFKNNAQNLRYTDYHFDENPSIWSQGTLDYVNNSGTIQFTKHFGLPRKTVLKIQQTTTGYLLLRLKKNGAMDTTIIQGTPVNPTSVITKIGKSIYSIEVYVPEHTSTSDIAALFNRLGVEKNALATIEKTVVFTTDNKPVAAFQLNETFSQITKTKEWEYAETGNLVRYQEWIGNSLTKTIVWKYRVDELPESMTVDRKEYFYIFE